MKLLLILAGPYTSCESTSKIWSEICHAANLELEIYHLDEEPAKTIAHQIKLTTFPALIYDYSVIAIGHPDKKQAEKIIDDFISKFPMSHL